MLNRIPAQKLQLLALMLLALYPIAIAAARLELWHFRNSFLIFVLAALFGFAVLVISILKMAKDSSQAKPLVISVLATGIPLAFLASNIIKAQTHPFIHDITTDVTNPPQFVAAKEQRTEGDHDVAYDAANVEPTQTGYPDLKAITLNNDAKTAVNTAKVLMQKQGWEILAINEETLPYTLEASETTLLFGFIDDVSLRFETLEDGKTLVNMRSMSRQGKSDLGVNAKRIKEFFALLKAE